MKLNAVVGLSHKITAGLVHGLVNGEVVRRGGVLHKVAAAGSSAEKVVDWLGETTSGAGKVVAWMRETTSTPAAPASLAAGLNQVGGLLGLVGSVSSVLTLGATIGFGVAALRKLAQVEKRVQEIEGKIDRLQWTIELGFANTLRGLEEVAVGQEFEMVANLKSAARLAWEAQCLEPNGPQRAARLENALMLGTQASEQLILRTQHEMERAIEWMKQNKGVTRLDPPDPVLAALRRYRQTCLASATRAAIQAETASPDSAACGLEQDTDRLRPLVRRLGHAFLQGCEPGEKPEAPIYASLLKAHCIPVSRVESWARQFDPKVGSLAGVLDLLRRPDLVARTLRADVIVIRPSAWISNRERERAERDEVIRQKVEDRQARRENLLAFGDNLDGAREDADRLAGYVLEYRAAGQEGLSIQGYRDALRLPECPANRPVVFLVPKEEEAESAPGVAGVK
jgi:hypothetical protein